MSFKFNNNDDARIAIGLGNVTGVNAWSVFGGVASTVADVETDLGAGVSGEINLPNFTDGEQLEIFSQNNADTDEISVSGLGPGGVRLDAQIVTLTGSTPVQIPGLYSRVNGAQSVGVDGFDGDVIIRRTSGGPTYMTLSAEDQRSNQCMYTIAAGESAAVTTAVGTMEKSSGADAAAVARLKVKNCLQNKWGRVFGFGLQRSGDTSIQFDNRFPQTLEGPLDLKISAESTSSGVSIAAWLGGIRIDTGINDD